MCFVATRTNDTMNAKLSFQVVLEEMPRITSIKGSFADAYRTNKRHIEDVY